ncbi:MAG: OmpH family outer membrane protein [Candidatus Saganbacteria bacterium]|nr:OmpH family outer membrane protein [Candidatus Saganbacteria bacterium]
MFKKIIVSCVLVLFLASTVMAASSSLGYLDMQKVFKQYKEATKAQKELEKKQKGFKEEFEKSQKKLLEAEKKGKKQSELTRMKADMEKKLESKQKELMQYNQGLSQKLQKNILAASSKIAKKLALDLIIDKQAVIVGGMDVTDMVLTELNK